MTFENNVISDLPPSFLSYIHRLKRECPFAAKREYLSLLGRLLYESGCPLHRLESHLMVVSQALGLSNSTFVPLPGLLIFLLVDDNDEAISGTDQSDERKTDRQYSCTSSSFPSAASLAEPTVMNGFASAPNWWKPSFSSVSNPAVTHIIKVSRGYKMKSLQDIEDAIGVLLSHSVESPSRSTLNLNNSETITIVNNNDYFNISLQDDWNTLARIGEAAPVYSYSVKILAYGVYGMTCCPLIFKGSFADSCASFILGLFVGSMIELSEKMSSLRCVMEITLSLLVGFISRCLDLINPQYFCYWSISLAGIAWVLPGLSLTCAVMEISTGHLVSGTVNMFYSFVIAIMLGFGLSIGTKLVIWAPTVFPPMCPTASPIIIGNIFQDPWTILPTAALFIVCNLCVNVLLNAHPRQMLPMLFISGIGYVIYLTVMNVFTVEAASIASALTIGLLSVLYRHLTGNMAIAPVMSGIMILVPGSLGVKGVTSFLDKDIVSGVRFGFDMIVLAMSLSIGLFMSHLMGTPSTLKRPHPSILF